MHQIETLGFDRALIVQSRWCELILEGVKTWEMRSTKTNVRGTIGLIESGTGFIVGKATLVDSLECLTETEYFQHVDKHQIHSPTLASSKWKYPWVLEDAIKFRDPVRYIHPKGAVIWVKVTNSMLVNV